jgi:hypothetical protein
VRWLVVQPGPEFSVHDLYNGWTEALRELGEHVLTFDLATLLTFYDSVAIETGRKDDGGRPEFRKALTHDQAIDLAADRLFVAAYKAWPDVILIVSGFFTPPWLLEILRGRGHKIVLLMTECPYEDPRQLELAPYADVVLLNDPVTMPKYLDMCDTVAYSPHAYRPSVHYPRPGRKRFDLAFSGTGYQSRIDFFDGMGLSGLKVALAGNWLLLPPKSGLRKYLRHPDAECLDNTQTAELYGQARAGINFYRREHTENATAEGWAIGPREVEMAACGLWFLRDPRPEGDALFPQLPVFTDSQQAGELLRWALRNAGVRATGAAAAREAIADRTFSNNAKMLLRLLDRQPVTI